MSLICSAPGGGKAQSLDSKILTTGGWKTFSNIAEGDEVFGPDGKATKVLQVHPVAHNLDCYQVELSDGAKIVVAGDHEWTVRVRSRSRHYESVQTLDTRDMISMIHAADGGKNLSIPMGGAVDMPTADLPIDPYVLGYWLGDGDTNASRITIHQDDYEDVKKHWGISRIPDWGMKHETTRTVTIPGLLVQLRELGVLGNKHIPTSYLTASIDQRLALLQGLMDSDGSTDASGRKCEFTTTVPALAEGFSSLLYSLGVKHGYCDVRGKLYGIEHKLVRRFSFSTKLEAFRLPRKASRHAECRLSVRSVRRYVVAIRPVGSTPVRCITVDREDGLYLTGREMVITHNSALATHQALHADYSGEGHYVPTLYFSADSDESTLGDRATAAIVNKDTSTVHRLLQANDLPTWKAQEEATHHMWMNFDPSPTLDNIADEVDAFAFATGEYPHYIVVDNIMNVNTGGTSMGMESLYSAMEGLHILARETGAHVQALHHVTGDYTNGDVVIPRSGIMGKIDKLPRLILTLYKPMDDMMGICVVKNSNGPQDPLGNNVQFHVPWLPAKSWFFDGTVNR